MLKDESAGRCGVCGEGQLCWLYELETGSVVRCGSCGAAATLFARGESPDQRRYDRERWLEARQMLGGRLMEQARQRYRILRKFGPGKDVLEVGCCTGEFMEVSKENGHSVTGVEISPAAVGFVRSERPGLDVRHCPVEDAGFPPGSFDVVAAFHLLEHIEEPAAFIGRLREILRPDGLLYLRMPNMDSWFRKAFGAGWWGFNEAHVRHFTPGSLRTLLESGSFLPELVGTFEDFRESYWPVLPLVAGRGRLMRKVGDILAPKNRAEGRPGTRADARTGARRAVKKALLGAYMSYRMLGSAALYPLLALQSGCGGGSELFAVARKRGR